MQVFGKVQDLVNMDVEIKTWEFILLLLFENFILK